MLTPPPPRRSIRRLAGQPANALATIERARKVLRKKWGIAEDAEEAASESAMLQSFIDLFKEPLSADEIEAVKTLFGSFQLSKSRAGRGRATRSGVRRAAA